jgi:hypothetical protein
LAFGVGFFLTASFAVAVDQLPEKSSPKPEAPAKTVPFKQPRSLADLLAINPDDLDKVDVAVMNLLCAQGLRGSENLDVQQCLDTLDAWARHVGRETQRNFHHFAESPEEFKNALAYYRMGMLGTILAEDLRIQYNPDLEQVANDAIKTHALEKWNRFFTDSGDIFIHGLISRKHYGTCSSMPFLYVSLGRRLGYPVSIAARKNHLYLRYDEGNGEHLNIEATENRGFSTPSDEEFRTSWPQMTEEQIRGMGWLRPLSNKEVMAICLLNRSSCLRSVGRYEEANGALDLAAGYHPDTTLARRVLEKNRKLNGDLIAAGRWDALWSDLENLLIPSGGPMAEYFRNKKVETEFFMNQSTNIAEIERTFAEFKAELARYRAEISDDPARVRAAFSPPQPSAEQQRFLAMLTDFGQSEAILLPRERVPADYWRGMPQELESRLAKLVNPNDIVEEINLFHNEEVSFRNVQFQTASPAGMEATLPPLWHPHEHFLLSELGIHLERIPWTYQHMEIPPELQKRLVWRTQNLSDGREEVVLDEIHRFEGDRIQRRLALAAIQQRRRPLDREPLTHPPSRVEIVASVPDSAPPEKGPTNAIFLLTPESESTIKATTLGKGKP